MIRWLKEVIEKFKKRVESQEEEFHCYFFKEDLLVGYKAGYLPIVGSYWQCSFMRGIVKEVTLMPSSINKYKIIIV